MPDILYQYTSLNTLKSIIEESIEDSIELRATDIEYLNDQSEYKIALKILIQLLCDFEERLDEDNKKGILKYKNFELMDHLKEKDFNIKSFITSFTEEKDSLPMWNTYGNNSLGVAIGFDKSILKDSLNSSSKLEECIYNKSLVTEKLKDDIAQIYNCLRFNDGSFGWTTGIGAPIFNAFRDLVPVTKDDSYHYEKEWRVILKQDYECHKLKFQISNDILKPYLTFNIPKKAIKKIVIGPCSNFDLISKPLFMLLKKANIEAIICEDIVENKVNIIKSICPYRNI